MERRLSKTLPRLEVDSILIDHILPLAEEGTIFEGCLCDLLRDGHSG